MVSQQADEITNPFTVPCSPYELDGRVGQGSTDFPKKIEIAC
jgi:hypothetical protein